MPRDSNGNASTDPVYVAVPGTTIRAVQHNTPIADIIQMLTGSLARNGTGGMLADLAMGGFKITGLSDGTSAQDAVTKAQLDAKLGGLPQLGAWTNVASASTVNLGALASRNLVITGTTTITSFGTAGAADNVPYLLRFSGILTLTNGASLILPGGANIVTAAGDVAVVVHDTASVWRVAVYSRAAMPPLVSGTSANNLVALDGSGKLPAVDGSLLTGLAGAIKNIRVFTASGTYTPTAGTSKALVIVTGGGGGGYATNSGGPKSGGGSGATAIALIDNPTSQTVTIGAGGGNGADGGTTSFGTIVTAGGGGRGGYVSGVGDAAGGAGGTVVTGANVGIPGGAGADVRAGDSSDTIITPGAGGSSFWGGRGSFGAGGRGGNTSTGSVAAGSSGVIVVLEY